MRTQASGWEQDGEGEHKRLILKGQTPTWKTQVCRTHKSDDTSTYLITSETRPTPDSNAPWSERAQRQHPTLRVMGSGHKEGEEPLRSAD